MAIASSGPPPPIPRRAAARTRVVSRPVTPANASANAEPAAAVADTTAEAKEPAKESGVAANAQEGPTPTEAEDAAKGDKRVDTEKPAAKETAEERSSEAERLDCVSPESDLYVDAPTPGEPMADEQAEEKAGDDEDDKRTIVEELDSAVEKAVVNGVLTEEPIHVNGVQEEGEVVDAEEARLEEEEQTKKEEEKTRVTYVGDATWEEKTWKEIVRLREDMFWARMGGVRE